MNKLQHLKQTKQFLRKTVRHRRQLLRMGYGRPDSVELAKAIAEVEYQAGNIPSFDRMMNYLDMQKTHDSIGLIIPKNKQKWHDELRRLINQGHALQGKTSTAKQAEFSF